MTRLSLSLSQHIAMLTVGTIFYFKHNFYSDEVVFSHNFTVELYVVYISGRCDYDPGPHNVLISTDMTTFTYNIIISDDDVYEINEELSVNIASSNHSQIKISPTSRTARVTILDDEEREWLTCIIRTYACSLLFFKVNVISE